MEKECVKNVGGGDDLQGIFDVVPAMIFYKDRENRILRVNKTFCEVTGMSKEALEGKSLFDLYPEEQAKAYWKDDREVISSGTAKTNIIEFVQTRNGTRWVQTDKMPYRDERGAIIGVIGFAIDITERKKAEDRLRDIRDDLNRAQAVAHTGSWRLDVNKNELTWSDENHRMFGVPRGKPMTYETFLSTVHPDDQRHVDEKWTAALRGAPYDIEHRIVVGGEIRWVRERATLEFDEHGRLLGGFGTTQDITERKKAEQALRESEAALQESRLRMALAEAKETERKRLYSVLETLPVYVVLLTPDYHVSFANKFFRERFGEDRGRRCFEYLFNREKRCEDCETYKVLTTNAPHRWEWTGPDGRNYDIYDFPFKETDGAVHIMEMGIDITDRKRAQDALLEAQREIDRARRLADIGTLAATVAHELRNPLAAMRMATYNIKKKGLNPELDKHLINIERKIVEGEQIINNLLFYARIKNPEFEDADICGIVHECVESLEIQCRKRTIALMVHIEPLDGVRIKADPLQIKETVINILNNAYDAVADGSGVIELRGSVKGADAIELLIRDNGVGIEKENLEKVFEPFFTTKSKGTGLGLSVCCRIVRLHDGAISIESERGRGTTVNLTLLRGGQRA